VHAGDLDEADELQIMSFFAGTATMVINRASPLRDKLLRALR
jgi:hypothetical protein